MGKIASLVSALFIVNSVPALAQESTYIFRLNFERPRTSVREGSIPIPDLYVGENVAIQGTYAGGDGKVTWRSSGSPLPLGLSLSESGFLGGIPLAGGTYTGISFKLTDQLNSSFAINPGIIHVYEQPSIVPVLKRLVIGKYESIDLGVHGGKTPYNIVITGGGLPDGMTLSGTKIEGTPEGKGNYNSVIDVSDMNGRHKAADALLEVYDALFAASDLGDGYVGVPYSGSLHAAGGETPYTWYLLDEGRLPAGLTFQSDGTLSGTPLNTGKFDMVAKVADGSTQFFDLPISVGVYDLPKIATASMPDIYVGEPLQFALEGNGGRAPLTWSGTNLPSGLSINPSTGNVAGVANSKETVLTTFQLSDFNGRTDSKSFNVSTYDQLALSAKTFSDAYVGAPYDGQPPVLSGGKPSISWTAAGLPDGLTMNAATGEISGVPTTIADKTVAISATDANSKTVSRNYGLSTRGALSLQAKVYTDPYVGIAYTASEGAAPVLSGGKAPYVWSASNLPQGLNINSGTGDISGVPTSQTSITSSITVTDANSKTIARAYDFAVRPQLVISVASLPSATAAITNVNHTFTATGGKPGYFWSYTGNLPAGLGLSTTGILSGVPSVPNTYSFTVVVTDANSRTTSQNATLVVSAPSNCTAPWGETLAHGASIAAYQAASVPWNGTCSTETRACNNGTLSGTYSNKTCVVTAPTNCATPWGTTVNHGASITAYQAASVPSDGTCASQTRTCTNGTLSGSYANSSCVKNCSTPWGTAVNNGAAVTAYQAATVAWNATCTSQSRTCSNGTLSGTYTNKACTVTAPLNCTAPWGGALTHGSSVTAYQAATVPYGSTCASQARTCTNGALSGSYTSKTCTVTAPLNCQTTDGVTIAHGTTINLYPMQQTSYCNGMAKPRTCTNGVWDPLGAGYTSCTSTWGSH